MKNRETQSRKGFDGLLQRQNETKHISELQKIFEDMMTHRGGGYPRA
ncbi:MAG: hypothetical protein SFW35_11125 [Chitinophagales bacterium]|nr:hypothetical protein [Chitinophagales bacterium]